MSVPAIPPRGRRVGLALGGGGARGYAHLGVIEVLTEQGFDIAAVAGSSMGALVGGLYAAGRLTPYTAWVRTIGQRDILRLLDPRLRGPGAIGAEKVMARVGELIGDVCIEQLPIPFTAVATDLLARRAVWFQRGPLVQAIRASIALPPAITPVMVQGRLLSDGGLMDPVPIAPITSAATDLVVAVSLNGLRSTGVAAPARQQSADRDACEAPDQQPDGLPDGLPPGLRKIDVVNLSMEAVSALLTRYRLAALPPDLLIEVPVDACGTLDFHRAEEMINLGRQAATAALTQAGLTV
jgi:NTE family protein